MRSCIACKAEFPDDSDAFAWRNKRRKTGKCRSCHAATKRRWYAGNAEKAKRYSTKWKQNNPEVARDASAKDRHGVPYGTYAAKLAAQGGVCAICGCEPPPNRRFHFDHDHETGEYRDLLCDLCNRGLGYFKDQPELLAKALEYLRRHGR